MQQLARWLRDAWAWASKLACQKSEKRVHLARLHTACMAARPFRPLVWAKVGVACNRWAGGGEPLVSLLSLRRPSPWSGVVRTCGGGTGVPFVMALRMPVFLFIVAVEA